MIVPIEETDKFVVTLLFFMNYMPKISDLTDDLNIRGLLSEDEHKELEVLSCSKDKEVNQITSRH